ncbi:MAG TPA: glycosyl hydrolase [Streptosporangiaceae bacterium]
MPRLAGPICGAAASPRRSIGRRPVWARLAALSLALLAASTGCSGSTRTPTTNAPAAGSRAAAAPGGGRALFGAFLGSDETGVARIPEFEQFLGGVRTRVGHTYLAGDDWSGVDGLDRILDPWARWRAERPGDLFVLNVPMATPNEADLDDGQVAALLAQGAQGAFDQHYATLANRLVARGLGDAVIIPGWEMNGTTYSHRCAPDPESWKRYFRRVVATMRAVPGQSFRFDFNPSRGTDAISWQVCYPGDEVVDIIGMDSYDQPPGASFQDYVRQPDGLQAQVDFAREHGKPVSYPEWGLFKFGDNPQFIEDMLRWIASQDTVYSTFTDYCPHGVFECPDNPRSAQRLRQLIGGR